MAERAPACPSLRIIATQMQCASEDLLNANTVLYFVREALRSGEDPATVIGLCDVGIQISGIRAEEVEEQARLLEEWANG